MQIPTAPLILLACVAIACAPNSPAQTLPPMCAAFTPDGQSLAATVDGAQIQLQITSPSGESSNLSLSPDDSDPIQAKIRGAQNCQISISASGKNAAIGVGVYLPPDPGLRIGLFIVTLDLQTKTWTHPILLTAQGPLHPPSFIGFLQASEDQIVVNTSLGYCEPAATFAVVNLSDGSTRESNLDTTACHTKSGLRRTYVDSRRGLIWLIEDKPPHKQQFLASVSLLDAMPGSAVPLQSSQSNGPTPRFAGAAPEAVAFPSLNRILLADSAGLAMGPAHLWILDSDSNSFRLVNLPKDLGQVLLHGLGFGWYENVEGRIVSSPDGRFAVVPVGLLALGPPYIVDNYESKGQRLVIVDLDHARIMATVQPQSGLRPRAFALDHRNGKVTLLVNWKDQWQRQEFPAEPGPS
jgi:hypothetical protein